MPKQYEYLEGGRAQENFEEGMKALFNVPKDEVARAERKEKKKLTSRRDYHRKAKISDKD